MGFSTLLLRVDINVTLQDEANHFCRLTSEQIVCEDLRQKTLVPALTKRFFCLALLSLTQEEMRKSIAEQANFLTGEYLDECALCQHQVSTRVVFPQKDSLKVTVNIHLSPNPALEKL